MPLAGGTHSAPPQAPTPLPSFSFPLKTRSTRTIERKKGSTHSWHTQTLSICSLLRFGTCRQRRRFVASPSRRHCRPRLARSKGKHPAGECWLHEMEEPPEKRYPLASLTDELLVEIFSHLPVRSLCRFKCVSRSWRDLISDRGYRKKLPHTLVGFFYRSFNWERIPRSAQHFTNVTGKGIPFLHPSFSFLPVCSDDVVLLDCCNGLLLCRCYLPGPRDSNGDRPFHYAVCNPATEKWVMLPDGSWAIREVRTARLGFDPAVSSHFHVMEYVEDEDGDITGVGIYSSKAATWSFSESEWIDDAKLYHGSRSVFLNGIMHSFVSVYEIVAVDTEGKRFRTIPTPPSDEFGFIHQADGHLLYFDMDPIEARKLSVWILEDYGTDEWTVKYRISTLGLFGGKSLRFDIDYKVIAVHPECNLVFFVYGRYNTLMAYEMDRREVRVICNLVHEPLGPYLPYVPYFSDSFADKH